jgi:Cft2 family RNA processing exonuclease
VNLTVRRQKGIIVEYDGSGIIFDPTKISCEYPVFVTHAHSDHASALRRPEIKKYATPETIELLKVSGWNNLDNISEVNIGDRIRLGEFEIIVHNAGHILGSVMYEVCSPEGNLLYTGDIGLEDTFTVTSAKSSKCDMLVVESTFGAPMFKFPKISDVGIEMVRWAVMDIIPKARIPTFKTDSIGNAQEIISIFNKMTKLPVVTNRRTTKISEVYLKNGFNLDFHDVASEEGQKLLELGTCVFITSKGSRPKQDNLENALASGWAVLFGNRGRAFPLSDHADYVSLIKFIRDCNPKRVFTFHGGSMTKDFHKRIKNTLGIDAKQLSSRFETINGTLYESSHRINACSSHLIRTIRIPGFLYSMNWLSREMNRRGFTEREVKDSVNFLIDQGILESFENEIRIKRS